MKITIEINNMDELIDLIRLVEEPTEAINHLENKVESLKRTVEEKIRENNSL